MATCGPIAPWLLSPQQYSAPATVRAHLSKNHPWIISATAPAPSGSGSSVGAGTAVPDVPCADVMTASAPQQYSAPLAERPQLTLRLLATSRNGRGDATGVFGDDCVTSP